MTAVQNPDAPSTQHDRIIAFYQEVATYVKQAAQGRAALIQAMAQTNLAKKDADTNAQRSIQNQVAQIERVTNVAETAVLDRTKKLTLASAESLLGDIEARLQHHAELVKQAKSMAAQIELADAMGEFAEGAPSGMTRADADVQVAAVEARVQKQLDLAEALIPVTAPAAQSSIILL